MGSFICHSNMSHLSILVVIILLRTNQKCKTNQKWRSLDNLNDYEQVQHKS